MLFMVSFFFQLIPPTYTPACMHMHIHTQTRTRVLKNHYKWQNSVRLILKSAELQNGGTLYGTNIYLVISALLQMLITVTGYNAGLYSMKFCGESVTKLNYGVCLHVSTQTYAPPKPHL
jgi:hypothetical protein